TGMPAQAPPHWRKWEPLDDDCLRRTGVPSANDAEHVPGQLTPTGMLVTAPSPVRLTARRTRRALGGGDAVALRVVVAPPGPFATAGSSTNDSTVIATSPTIVTTARRAARTRRAWCRPVIEGAGPRRTRPRPGPRSWPPR